MQPFSTEEIKNAWKALKNGAPGPDRIKLTDLKTMPQGDVHMFNLWWLHRELPSSLKKAHTTLILKVIRAEVSSQFRPITVASMMVCWFHSMIGCWLHSVPLKRTQKGFQKFDALSQNIWLLRSLMSRAWI